MRFLFLGSCRNVVRLLFVFFAAQMEAGCCRSPSELLSALTFRGISHSIHQFTPLIRRLLAAAPERSTGSEFVRCQTERKWRSGAPNRRFAAVCSEEQLRVRQQPGKPEPGCSGSEPVAFSCVNVRIRAQTVSRPFSSPRPRVPSQVGTNPSAFFGFAETFGIMASRVWLAPPPPHPPVSVSPSHAVAFGSAPSSAASGSHRADVCRCVTRRAVCVCVCFSCEIKSIKDVVSQRWPPVVAHEVFSPHPEAKLQPFL